MSESVDILSQSEIDNLLASLTGGAPPAREQNSISNSYQTSSDFEEVPDEDDKKGYKLYNFRRPDKFSKDHLRALQDIHKEFSRQFSLVLSAYLRMHVDIEVISVDQLTYDEFTRSMPNPITVGIVELNPLPGQILVGMSHEVVSSLVDRMLGGVGYSESRPRELTDIEEALARRIFERMTRTLEDSWRGVFPVQGMVVGIDSNYSLIQIANSGEIVSLITLEVQIASRFAGLLSICFPYPVLETVLSQLSSQHIFQSKGIITTSEDKQQMINKLNNATVGLNVILGGADITMKDFLDLKEGDVIRLENSVEDDLLVCINGESKFLARPGTSKNKISIKIVDSYEEKDQ
jgi:flagellar motor switch protein FliM